MASLLKKLRPGVPLVVDDGGDGEFSVEYSFAEEYKGPPLSYFIPEVPAFKLEQIPVAPIASSSLLHHSSVPVIQPIRKTTNATALSSVPSSHPQALDSPNFGGGGDDHKQDLGFHHGEENLIIPTKSGSTSPSVSSEIFSSREEDDDDDHGDNDDPAISPKHVKRPSAVTFRYPEPDDVVEVEEDFVDSEYGSGMSTPVSYERPQHAVRAGKKGTCYRCLKGNRFTQREVCVVCSAKYCCKCVLRAMGAMPEGRKCVTCIGCRIDEDKRSSLGKSSRMLKHLLSDMEVKKIMHDEMFCDLNAMPAEKVCVNGDSLDRDKLKLLLTCPNPPKGLKPGFYWYDKASGFWGKEGQRPSQIISPELDVGGHLQRNASGGKTNVTINGRAITKKELWLLKFAGVQCEGTTDFWVSPNGEYMEVGQKNIKGKIWDKFGAKVASKVLSLPVPSNSVAPSEEGDGVMNRDSQDIQQQKMLHKFLLVGSAKSGTSTIFKQAKHQYNIPFSENERQTIKLVIQRNLCTYLGMLLEGRESFEEECLLEKRKYRQHVDESSSSEGNTGEITETTIYSIGPRLEKFADWLINYMVSGNLDTIFPDVIEKYGPLVEELWSDAAIQATYNRRHELKMLPRSATYFLDRAVEISKTDYEPSEMDIMYAEGINLSNSVTSMEFSFPVLDGEESLEPEYQHDPSLIYQLIRVHLTSLGENCKWLDMFEDTDVVLFSVALTDYDEYIVDCNGVSTNKMMLAKCLFENIITHRVFNNKKFLLLLTKFDLLEEKNEDINLSQCEWFSDFNPVISHSDKKGSTSNNNHTNSPPLPHRAFQYIAMNFKRLFNSLTGRKLFVSLVNGLEPDTVDEALRYARDVMLLEKRESSLKNDKSEITSTFDEATTS